MLIRFMTVCGVKAIFIFFICVALTGCGYTITSPIIKKDGVTTQDDIGSVHVAVLSVAPWDKYVEELQPLFKLTAADALNKVVPTTSIIDSKLMNILGAGLKVALTTTAVTDTITTVSEAGKDTTTKRENKEEKKPGDLSSVSGGTVDTPDRKANDMAGVSGDVHVDSMTKYLAATALFQEVALLNRYIKDAADVYDGDYVPYVVRLQVSLMPRRSDLSYDAYTNLSFFSKDQRSTVTVNQRSEDIIGRCSKNKSTDTDSCFESERREEEKNGEVYCYEVHRDKEGNETKKEVTLSTNDKCVTIVREKYPILNNNGTPTVLPLLVTDNIVNILSSRSENQLRQYGLAIGAMIESVGIGASFKNAIEKIENERGNYLNSLLTVAKLSDNSIRVRFGAMKQTGANNSGYAMVPRTHNITVLLMMPKAYAEKKVMVSAKTIMLNSKTGEYIPGRNFKKSKEVEDVFTKTGLDKLSNGYEIAGYLVGIAEENDWVNFVKLCKEYARGEHCGSLWADMISLRAGSSYAFTSFKLPRDTKPVLFPTQAALLLDDTKGKTIVTLTGGENLKKEYLSATLYIDNTTAGGKSKNGGDKNCTDVAIENYYPFIAENIELTSGGKTAEFVFPSLKAWGLNSNTSENRIKITYSKNKGEVCLNKILYMAKPAEEAKGRGFTATVTPTSVSANKDGEGILNVTFKKTKANPAQQIYFNVRGADIEKITSKPANIFSDDDTGEIYVKTDGTLTLYLKNLGSNSNVVINTWKENKDALTNIVLPVERLK